MPVLISAMAASALKRERRRFSTSRAEESGGGGAPFKATARTTDNPHQDAICQYLRCWILNVFDSFIVISVGEHYNICTCITRKMPRERLVNVRRGKCALLHLLWLLVFLHSFAHVLRFKPSLLPTFDACLVAKAKQAQCGHESCFLFLIKKMLKG